MKTICVFRNRIGPTLVMLGLLAGCDIVDTVQSYFPEESNTVNSSIVVEDDIVPDQMLTPNPTEIPIHSGAISVWLPPQFDPQVETENTQLFNEHVSRFQKSNPGATVDFRIKAAQGTNSILNVLSVTALAAPDAQPTIILISRADMEKAADLGLIKPIEFYTDMLAQDDWFAISREMGTYNGETFGLPFVADALVMVTSNQNMAEKYFQLSSINQLPGQFGYSAGNSDSLIPYIWYQSTGGTLYDEQEQPLLEEALLTVLLSNVEENRRFGSFNSDMLAYQTDNQAWEAFTKGKLDSIFSWYSFADKDVVDQYLGHVPGLSEEPFTYADGWLWCLVQKETSDIEMNIAFMEHMLSEEFLREWISTSNYLPVRPSITGQNKEFIDRLLLSMHLPPNETVRDYSKESLTEAVMDILDGSSGAEEAAKTIIGQIEGTQTQ